MNVTSKTDNMLSQVLASLAPLLTNPEYSRSENLVIYLTKEFLFEMVLLWKNFKLGILHLVKSLASKINFLKRVWKFF